MFSVASIHFMLNVVVLSVDLLHAECHSAEKSIRLAPESCFKPIGSHSIKLFEFFLC
jgi:hypothetical protein